MAHRCWALDEIVVTIAAKLVADGGKASAVALACCSKALEGPTLGEVWRSLSCLVPLVKCFPPMVWGVEGKDNQLVIKRAPLRAEWTRFQKIYASKVHYLNVSNVQVSLHALQVFQLYSPGGSLLPNLRSLNWASDETHLPFVSLFISPSLTSIVITVPRRATASSALIPPIFNKLSTLSPNIGEITLDRLVHDSSVEEASSQLLMQCNQHLRKFKVESPISASALRHAIQLPSLDEFWLVVNSCQLPDPLPVHVFPSLRWLHVKCNADLTWLKLLPAIDSEDAVLTNITIHFLGSDFEWFMETFQVNMTGCAACETLQDLRVKNPADFKITPRIIACNFLFKNLTSLKLYSGCSRFCTIHYLSDDDIDLLTRALPCLKYLVIGEEPCGVPSQITFKSLYTLSHRCTWLTDLLIHFNPASFVAKVGKDSESCNVALGLSDDETLSSDLCPITTINVGNIPLPGQHYASCVMALGLLAVFPRLEVLKFGNGEWGKVLDLIGVWSRFPVLFARTQSSVYATLDNQN